MSHHTIIVSPPGTPLADRTVGELVAERPGRSRIFQAYEIDFCCQGGRTLREACQRRGLAVNLVADQLEAEHAPPDDLTTNPADLPPPELTRYIVETHHQFLRDELPRLHVMAARVAKVHGVHTPSLLDVFNVFDSMAQELVSHLAKEEEILFPAIVALSQDASEIDSLDGPIACMRHEHDDTTAAIDQLRALTRNYQPPPDACNTYRALFAGLRDLEDDLRRHIRLENETLFPAAEAMIAQQGHALPAERSKY